jgi:hypothetical protein
MSSGDPFTPLRVGETINVRLTSADPARFEPGGVSDGCANVPDERAKQVVRHPQRCGLDSLTGCLTDSLAGDALSAAACELLEVGGSVGARGESAPASERTDAAAVLVHASTIGRRRRRGIRSFEQRVVAGGFERLLAPAGWT